MVLLTAALLAGCAASPPDQPGAAVTPEIASTPAEAAADASPAAGSPSPQREPAASDSPAPTPTQTFLPPPTSTPIPTPDPNARPTLPVVATPGPLTAADGTVVQPESHTFHSGFAKGWPEVDVPGATAHLADGLYTMTVGPDALLYLNSTMVNADDAYVEARVQVVECPAGAGYGVFFRFRDAGNYYALTAFCEGRITATARTGGVLAGEPLLDASPPGGVDLADAATPHRLGVLAQGDAFTVYVDGLPVGGFSDDRHLSGDVAVYATSPAEAAIGVAFDSLDVWTVR